MFFGRRDGNMFGLDQHCLGLRWYPDQAVVLDYLLVLDINSAMSSTTGRQQIKGPFSPDFWPSFCWWFQPIWTSFSYAKVFSNMVSIFRRYSHVHVSPQYHWHHEDKRCETKEMFCNCSQVFSQVVKSLLFKGTVEKKMRAFDTKYNPCKIEAKFEKALASQSRAQMGLFSLIIGGRGGRWKSCDTVPLRVVCNHAHSIFSFNKYLAEFLAFIFFLIHMRLAS